MHKRSLERFDLDSVMLLYNYCQMQNPRYAADFEVLTGLCHQRNTAVQTIQSIARRPLGQRSRTYNMFFYEPLETQDAIEKSVQWALGLPGSFVITAGDIQLLPKMLASASHFEQRPSDAEMGALMDEFDIQPVFG